MQNEYSQYFKQINQFIIENCSYEINKCKNRYAVDGSKARLHSSLKDNGFPLAPSQKYCQALISTVFDVDRKIPIQNDITNNMNERSVFSDQIVKYLDQKIVIKIYTYLIVDIILKI